MQHTANPWHHRPLWMRLCAFESRLHLNLCYTPSSSGGRTHSFIAVYLDQFAALGSLCVSKTSACYASRSYSPTLSTHFFVTADWRIATCLVLSCLYRNFSTETTINMMRVIITIITIINNNAHCALHIIFWSVSTIWKQIIMNLLNWISRSLTVRLGVHMHCSVVLAVGAAGAGVVVYFIYSKMPAKQWALWVNCLSVLRVLIYTQTKCHQSKPHTLHLTSPSLLLS